MQSWRWLWRGDLPADNIMVEFTDKAPELPADMRRELDAFWLHEQARGGERVLFDGPLAQYLGHEPADDHLKLHLGRCGYAHWLFSAGRGEELERRFGTGVAARPLALCAGLITEGGEVLMQRRSVQVAEGAGLLHVPGGHLDPDSHRLNGRPDPTTAMRVELAEELGLGGTEIGDGRLLGLIENLENGKPELIYTWRLEAGRDETAQRWRNARDRFESREISFEDIHGLIRRVARSTSSEEVADIAVPSRALLTCLASDA